MKAIAAALVLCSVLVATAFAAEDEKVKIARDFQTEADTVTDEMMTKLQALELEYHKKKLPLYEKRNTAAKAVPGFWNRVIENHPDSGKWLKGNDKDMVKHITDIKVTFLDGADSEHHQYKIIVAFEPNPFFTDAELWREVRNDVDADDAKTSAVKWNAGKKPTGPSFFNSFETKATGGLSNQEVHDIAHVLRYEFYANPFVYYDVHDEPEKPSEDEVVPSNLDESD
jgi:template-activating factor I